VFLLPLVHLECLIRRVRHAWHRRSTVLLGLLSRVEVWRCVPAKNRHVLVQVCSILSLAVILDKGWKLLVLKIIVYVRLGILDITHVLVVAKTDKH